jgi:hypothetical protein
VGNGFKTSSETMRHSTIAMTADFYTHIDPENPPPAAERLDMSVALHDSIGQTLENHRVVPS